MTLLRITQRPLLIAIACFTLAACADTRPPKTNMDYRSDPVPAMRGEGETGSPSGRRLTIQSGEGERLNLPWFIQDTQDWVNSY